MKFFVDNNLSPKLTATLAALHPQHQYRCARDESLMATEDIPLFGKLVEREFSVLLTRDRNQLASPEEATALRQSRLHWLGLKESKEPGLLGLALDSAAITTALAHLLPELVEAKQSAYLIKAVPKQRDQRIRAIDLSTPAATGN